MNNNKQENNTVNGKKREIIKTILIVFLAVMLLLTFFSNTIMNRSLPEISTNSVTSGKLTERIRVSGMVEANQVYDIIPEDNKEVDTILVRKGQEVNKGDILFTVGTGESHELDEAEQMLETLELEYRKSLLTAPIDYSAENNAIANAREDLNDAIRKRDNAYTANTSQQNALAAYNSNKNELERKLSAEEALKNTISAIDSDEYSDAAAEYTENLVQLLNDYRSADEEYNTAYSLYSQLLIAGADASAAKAVADALKSDADKRKEEYDSAKASVRTRLVTELEALSSEIEYLGGLVSSYETEMENSSFVSLEELENDVTAKERILEELIISLSRTQKENNLNTQITNLDVEAKKAEVDKQKEKVDKLKNECMATEIASEYSGVVTAVNIRPGEALIPDTPALTIDVTEGGYTVTVSVDAEKAAKVRLGAEAEVINNWSGDVTAVAAEIRNDTESGSDNRIIIFNVSGDVDSGTNLDLSVACGSGNYDIIVPKSAVYEDSEGKFVLTVRSESSPLGNRYYAERVHVEILASDEGFSAVSGDLKSGSYVITAASAPVSPGQQVRIKE